MENQLDLHDANVGEIMETTAGVINATKQCNVATMELEFLSEAFDGFSEAKARYDKALKEARLKAQAFGRSL